MTYPSWSYFPRNVRPPEWAENFVGVVAVSESVVSTAKVKTGLDSDGVLKEIAPGLQGLGYLVETGKTKAGKIFRPVLFGENGVPEVSYEIDAFHDQLGVAVEVEAGRGAAGNADYRDIVRTSLILDANYLALLMPQKYRTKSGARDTVIPAYERTKNQLSANLRLTETATAVRGRPADRLLAASRLAVPAVVRPADGWHRPTAGARCVSGGLGCSVGCARRLTGGWVVLAGLVRVACHGFSLQSRGARR